MRSAALCRLHPSSVQFGLRKPRYCLQCAAANSCLWVPDDLARRVVSKPVCINYPCVNVIAAGGVIAVPECISFCSLTTTSNVALTIAIVDADLNYWRRRIEPIAERPVHPGPRPLGRDTTIDVKIWSRNWHRPRPRPSCCRGWCGSRPPASSGGLREVRRIRESHITRRTSRNDSTRIQQQEHGSEAYPPLDPVHQEDVNRRSR